MDSALSFTFENERKVESTSFDTIEHDGQMCLTC